MNLKDSQQAADIRRSATLYNQIPNVFWSTLSLVPIVYFCSVEIPLNVLWRFLVISFLTGFLPRSFFTRIQVGKTADVYKRLGIRFVKKYPQDGDLINDFLRKKHPAYRLVDTPLSIQKQLAKSYYLKKFHFVLLVFFVLTGGYALQQGYVGWTIILVATNVIYNVYPILLQQYNQLRTKQLMGEPSQITSLC